MDCLFCAIIKGEIPSKKIYEDSECYAFADINPQAPVHCLIVPKCHIASADMITEENAAVVARRVDPTAQNDRFADVRAAQFPASFSSKHRISSFLPNLPSFPTFAVGVLERFFRPRRRKERRAKRRDRRPLILVQICVFA